MKLSTFNYTQDKAWSIEKFPDMDSEQTLVLVFADTMLLENPILIQELSKHYPQSHMIGCSGAGEIAGARILDNGLSVCIVQFEKTELQTVKTEVKTMKDSFSAGEKIAKRLNKNDLSSIMVFSDGLHVNGSELVKGLNTLSKDHVVITGGLAGDGDRFKQTWVLYNGKVYKNAIVAVGLYGEDIQVGYASRGGWDIFGPERQITRAESNVLYELDGEPALSLYKKYLGDRAEGLPSTGLLFPLAIRQEKEDSQPVVRTILAIDEDNQSLIFAGDMPVGYRAQLMRANFSHLITSAGEAGEDAMSRIPTINSHSQGPILAIAISCVGRRLLLGERTEEETEAILDSLPSNTHQVGFYSYGELSPFIAGKCDLHNQTMTITTFYEKVNG